MSKSLSPKAGFSMFDSALRLAVRGTDRSGLAAKGLRSLAPPAVLIARRTDGPADGWTVFDAVGSSGDLAVLSHAALAAYAAGSCGLFCCGNPGRCDVLWGLCVVPLPDGVLSDVLPAAVVEHLAEIEADHEQALADDLAAGLPPVVPPGLVAAVVLPVPGTTDGDQVVPPALADIRFTRSGNDLTVSGRVPGSAWWLDPEGDPDDDAVSGGLFALCVSAVAAYAERTQCSPDLVLSDILENFEG